MTHITGTETHRASGKQVEFSAEYRLGIAGVSYSAVLNVEGCQPSRVGGFMAWTPSLLPPGRAVEKTVRQSVQFLDVAKLADRVGRAPQ